MNDRKKQIAADKALIGILELAELVCFELGFGADVHNPMELQAQVTKAEITNLLTELNNLTEES